MTETERKQQLYVLERMKERRNCEKSFYYFFKRAWLVAEPETTLVDNWHIKYLCDVLQAEVERIAAKKPKDRDLIINQPPRSLKSFLCTIMLNPWAWTKYPWMKFMGHSYNQPLAIDHAVLSRRIIQSTWYQELWGSLLDGSWQVFTMTSDVNLKSHYTNNRGGSRFAGSVPGRGADILTNDDPLDPELAHSIAHRQAANDFTRTFFTRLNDFDVGLRLLIMQRVHEEDPTGDQLARMQEYYKTIIIPATLYDGGDDVITPKELIPFYSDGLFFPARFTPKYLQEAKDRLGAYDYAGQMQQHPAPMEGGMFKRYFWNYWVPEGIELPNVKVKTANGVIEKIPVVLPKYFDEKIISWDMAFKDNETSDFVVGEVWARMGADKFLIDVKEEHLDFPATCDAVRDLKKTYKDTSCILIEDKANGPAVIAQLKSEIAGIIPRPADKSKVARARAYQRQAEAGNIYLPHPVIAKDWLEDFIEEHAMFPNAKKDNMVDSSSQGVNFLSEESIKVIQTYNQHNRLHHRNFPLEWEIVPGKLLSGESSLYASLWMKKDLSVGVLLCYWDGLDCKLYVFDEAVLDTARAEAILVDMRERLKDIIGEKKNIGMGNFRWYGNDLMTALKPGADGAADLFLKYRINILPNDFYDRFGSISLLNRMVENNMVIIHERCQDLNKQIVEWEIDQDSGNVPHANAHEENNLVLALSNIISVLVAHEQKKRMPLREYSAEKAKLFEIAGAVVDGHFDGFIHGIHGAAEAQSTADQGKHGWMV